MLELLNKKVENVIKVTYTIQDDISAFYYTELLGVDNTLIDSYLRDKDGNDIDDPALLEEVQVKVDDEWQYELNNIK